MNENAEQDVVFSSQSDADARSQDQYSGLLLVSAILLCSLFWLAVLKLFVVETNQLFDLSFAAGMGVFLSGFLCVLKASEYKDN